MDINGLSDYSYLTNQASVSAANMQNTINQTNESSTDDELLSACKQFESYLWEQIYKEMEKSVKALTREEDDNYSSQMVDYFSDMAIQEIAGNSTEDGANSLSQILYQQMKRDYGVNITAATEAVQTAMVEAE